MDTIERSNEPATIANLERRLDDVILGGFTDGLNLTAENSALATALIFLIYRKFNEDRHFWADFRDRVTTYEGKTFMEQTVSYFLSRRLPPDLFTESSETRREMADTLNILDRDPLAHGLFLEGIIKFIDDRGGVHQMRFLWMRQQTKVRKAAKAAEARRSEQFVRFQEHEARQELEKQACQAHMSVQELLAQRAAEAKRRDQELLEERLAMAKKHLRAIGKVQKRRPDQQLVYVDGENLLGLPANVHQDMLLHYAARFVHDGET